MMQMFEIMYIEYFLTADESFKKHLINSIPVRCMLYVRGWVYSDFADG